MNRIKLGTIYQQGMAKYRSDRWYFNAGTVLIFSVISFLKVYRGLWDWQLTAGLLLLGVAVFIVSPLNRYFYTLVYSAGQVLAKINTTLILFLVYYFLLFPTGLIKRLVSPDPRFRSFQKERDSYFTKIAPTAKTDYRKQS